MSRQGQGQGQGGQGRAWTGTLKDRRKRVEERKYLKSLAGKMKDWVEQLRLIVIDKVFKNKSVSVQSLGKSDFFGGKNP